MKWNISQYFSKLKKIPLFFSLKKAVFQQFCVFCWKTFSKINPCTKPSRLLFSKILLKILKIKMLYQCVWQFSPLSRWSFHPVLSLLFCLFFCFCFSIQPLKTVGSKAFDYFSSTVFILSEILEFVLKASFVGLKLRGEENELIIMLFNKHIVKECSHLVTIYNHCQSSSPLGLTFIIHMKCLFFNHMFHSEWNKWFFHLQEQL